MKFNKNDYVYDSSTESRGIVMNSFFNLEDLVTTLELKVEKDKLDSDIKLAILGKSIVDVFLESSTVKFTKEEVENNRWYDILCIGNYKRENKDVFAIFNVYRIFTSENKLSFDARTN